MISGAQPLESRTKVGLDEAVRPMRILLIAYRFPPQGGGGVQRPSKFAKYFVRAGHEVTVVTGPESWRDLDPTLLEDLDATLPRTSVPDPSPFRNLQEFRRNLSSRRAARGVQAALWAINEASLPDNTHGWIAPALDRTVEVACRFRPDLILVTGPPWSPLVLARLTSMTTGIPFVVDYRDPWTQNYLNLDEPRLQTLFNPFVERWVLRRAAGVIGAHRAILRRLQPILKPETPRIWVPNGYDTEDFEAANRRSFPPREDASRFTLSYTGSFFFRRNPGLLFGVLESLLSSRRIDPDRFRFRVAGDLGPARRLLGSLPHFNAALQKEGYLPHLESIHVLRTSDVNLVFESDGTRNLTTPAKFYETLAAEKPILLLSPPGVTERLGRSTGGCFVANPFDEDEIRRAILEPYDLWVKGEPIPVPESNRFRYYDRNRLALRTAGFLQRVVEREANGGAWSKEASAPAVLAPTVSAPIASPPQGETVPTQSEGNASLAETAPVGPGDVEGQLEEGAAQPGGGSTPGETAAARSKDDTDTGESMAGVAALNGSAAAIRRVISVLVSTVLTPVVLRGIGRDLYGVLQIAGSIYDYLALFRGGLGSAARRHVTFNVQRKDKETARAFYEAGFWWGTILRVPILIIAMLLAGPACDFVNVPAELRHEAILGVRLILFAAWIGDFAAMFEVPIYASGRTYPIHYLRASMGILRLLVIASGFALLVPTFRLYGILLTIVTLALTGGMGWIARRADTVGPILPPLRLGTPKIRREIFSYGGLSLLGQIAELLWISSDNILVGRIFGPPTVTLYSFGARWMPLIQASAMSILRSMQPLFTKFEAEETEGRSRRATQTSVALSSAFAVPICFVPCVLGDLFLQHWVGAEYMSGYGIILITLIPLSLDLTLFPLWVVLSARGRIGWISYGELSLSILKIILALTLTLGFDLGIFGFAWANGAALLVRNFVLRPLAIRKMDAVPPVAELAVPYFRAILGASAALVLLALARPFYGGSLAGVVGAGVAGGVLALTGALWATMGSAGLSIFRRILQRRR